MRLPDWQIVRQLSQLSLLNRIAFVMLVLVPVFCGMMRPILNGAIRYNQFLSETRQDIVEVELVPDSVKDLADSVREQLGGSEETTDAENSAREQQNLPAEKKLDPVRGFLVNRFDWQVDVPWLPRPWGIAFFAAMLILIGDTIVQTRCPAKVRLESQEEYVASQAERFAKCPSESALSEARGSLQASSMCTELLEREVHLQTQIAASKANASAYDLESLKQVRISLIEAASRLLYLELAEQRRVAASSSLLCYLCAGLLIVKVLQEQSFNVMFALGW